MDGKEFLKTKEALVAKQKGLNKEGKGNKPNAARMLTDEEVDILYGQDLLGCSLSEGSCYYMVKQHSVVWIARLSRAQGHDMGRC